MTESPDGALARVLYYLLHPAGKLGGPYVVVLVLVIIAVALCGYALMAWSMAQTYAIYDDLAELDRRAGRTGARYPHSNWQGAEMTRRYVKETGDRARVRKVTLVQLGFFTILALAGLLAYLGFFAH